MQQDKIYTADVIEICENGDAIIELPPQLIEELGWQIGDTLDITGEEGKVIIRNLDNDNRKKSLDKTA